MRRWRWIWWRVPPRRRKQWCWWPRNMVSQPRFLTPESDSATPVSDLPWRGLDPRPVDIMKPPGQCLSPERRWRWGTTVAAIFLRFLARCSRQRWGSRIGIEFRFEGMGSIIMRTGRFWFSVDPPARTHRIELTFGGPGWSSQQPPKRKQGGWTWWQGPTVSVDERMQAHCTPTTQLTLGPTRQR
jgi:hypothetical protein